MSEQDYGRPPSDAFLTVRDPEQARLLSDLQSFRYLEPFIARTQTVKGAAEAVGCKLDTMLYRVKTFLRAGLLKIEKVEKRAGRPIKHYRSAHDAYLIPFEVTPYAGLEERIEEQLKELQEPFAKSLAKLLREQGREGRSLYRRKENGEVWHESAGETPIPFDFFSADVRARVGARTGWVGESLYVQLELSQGEAKAFLGEFYELWLRYRRDTPKSSTKPLDKSSRGCYHLQFTFLPEVS